jgi:hypothetical protein
LILPAGGTTLCWLLLMTLWLPLLDFARSYKSMSKQVAWQVKRQACVEVLGLNTAQIAALRYHQKLNLRPTGPQTSCPYLLVDTKSLSSMGQSVNRAEWERMIMVRRPADRSENVVVFRRYKPAPAAPTP